MAVDTSYAGGWRYTAARAVTARWAEASARPRRDPSGRFPGAFQEPSRRTAAGPSHNRSDSRTRGAAEAAWATSFVRAVPRCDAFVRRDSPRSLFRLHLTAVEIVPHQVVECVWGGGGHDAPPWAEDRAS